MPFVRLSGSATRPAIQGAPSHGYPLCRSDRGRWTCGGSSGDRAPSKAVFKEHLRSSEMSPSSLTSGRHCPRNTCRAKRLSIVSCCGHRAFGREREVSFVLGRRVVSVDPDAHTVTLADGERLAYRVLIWATGGAPRRLACAGGDLAGVHSVRSRADVDRMMAELSEVSEVVVIGGGYIGLEAAAVLSKQGT